MVVYRKSNLINSDGYDLDQLKDEADVLEITLVDQDDNRLLIKFDSYFTYRKIHESFALQIIDLLSDQNMVPSTLVEAENSDYVQWFKTEGDGVVSDIQIKHYLVLTIDAIIEVLTDETPTVTEI